MANSIPLPAILQSLEPKFLESVLSMPELLSRSDQCARNGFTFAAGELRAAYNRAAHEWRKGTTNGRNR